MGKVLDLEKLPTKAKVQATADLCDNAESISVYSPEEFQVMFKKKVVTIKKGYHPYSAAFAVWLVQKYGPQSFYGKTHRTVKVDGKEKLVENPVLLDYDPLEVKEIKAETKK